MYYRTWKIKCDADTDSMQYMASSSMIALMS